MRSRYDRLRFTIARLENGEIGFEKDRRAGRLVAFPTETVYGLGANALDAEAVARIYAVKRRPPTSPLIVHVYSLEMAKSLVASWPEAADRLAEKFWPGPLTLVLPTSDVGVDAFVRPAKPS